MSKNPSSRLLAKDWPFIRHKAFDRQLRETATEWFSKHNLPVHPRMGYCLKSLSDWEQNILCPDAIKYIKEQRCKKSLALHKYFHHGLSSQAMVFNLLGPFIARENWDQLKVIFERCGVIWPDGKVEAKFEYDNRDTFNEDVGQPTSIDLAFKGADTSIFIEAKLIEKEFGGCSLFTGGDCDGANPCRELSNKCYLSAIGRRYWDRLADHGFLADNDFFSGQMCALASYYQFFREVTFALSNNGQFVLLVDGRNPAFQKETTKGKSHTRGLWPFLMKQVPERHRKSIHRITIQQMVREIEALGQHIDWVREFKDKYGIE